MDSSWEGCRKIVLTVDPVVAPEEREKFRTLTRPETYHRIRPHSEPGERGAYTVLMTYEEYQRALADVEDSDVNLVAAEIPAVAAPALHYIPNRPNLAYVGLRKAQSSYGRGEGAIVGVIDGGLSPTVRDRMFAGRIAAAADFTDTGGPYSQAYYHGTHMAGLAVPPASEIAIAKIYYDAGGTFGGGTYDSMAEAIYWCVGTAGADVINCSFGGSSSAVVLSDAIAYALGAGVLVLASMGNAGANVVGYPAAYTGVLAISNYDCRTDSIAPSSTYGPHVFAAAGGMDHDYLAENGGRDYLEDGGTSAACAMATRVATYPLSDGLSAEATKDQLASSARPTGAGAIYEGNGVLHLVLDGKGFGV